MFRQEIAPRYRGFNLQGMFASPTSKYTFGVTYNEEEFRIAAEWGFDYLRLPLSYRVWSTAEAPYTVREERLRELDKAVEYADKYGLHITMAMHRIPGYCINDDEPIPEPYDLWTSEEAYRAAEFQWQLLAERYKKVPDSRLDFDLINEPAYYVNNAHQAVVQHRLTQAIRRISPERTLMINGAHTGRMLPAESLHIGDENILYSLRGYAPESLTHYGFGSAPQPTPVWPGSTQVIGCATMRWDRRKMDEYHDMWAAASQVYGRGIICNELGCYNRTPHKVALAWLEDELASLKEHNIGWAMWNLVGDFGVLNSQREDVDYIDHYGYKLDKKMLDVLLKY